MAEPFDSSDFTFEIKWDGYRALAFLDSETRLQSRNLKDITAIFPELANTHRYLRQPGIILDGELVALRNGKPSFLELHKRGQLRNEFRIRTAVKSIPIVYVVFDLLYLNYRPVFSEPLERRRELLADNLNPSDEIILANSIEHKGIAYFQSISDLGLEGVIAKKRGSVYLPGKRTKTWLKFKRKQHGNFIICGYLTNRTSRGELSSLLLGAYFENSLTFCGMVGTGFSKDELEVIFKELQKIKSEKCPFPEKIRLQPKGLYWTKPIIVCEVEYLELTDNGTLRHPSFNRFRPDLKPEACTIFINPFKV